MGRESQFPCESWNEFANDQLGAGPWDSGSTVNPGSICAGCTWTISCN